MKFFVPAFLFAATAMALPGSGHAASHSDNEVENAVNQCGNGAQMSCCNTIHKNKNITQHNVGVLSNVLGAVGSEGLGLGQGCSQLNIPVSVLGAAGLTDFLKKNCQQNVACCQNSSSEANNNLVGIAAPCVSFGSLL
ncbi:fungal hydrophobin [Penicillium psychrosexuale]|uniref:fungal hydrophobin n=1 Tax=Penicillium psychrosexuale TaxID=1002107 RepID=UPI002545B97A|nr:fungal hydrophobin [Penicillium psychrosexuale]KAJ5800654.1 fungal hydrophobin [Penicillium psychrosexuale]